MPKDTVLIEAVMLGWDANRLLPLITVETINAKGELGKTALHNACLCMITPDVIIDVLLKNGANINMLDDDGLTPLVDAGKKASVKEDIYTRKACKLISNGAIWPDTEMGRFLWGKLPMEIQQLFNEKFQAYQEEQKRLRASEKAQAFGMLSVYPDHLHKNFETKPFNISSTGLHRRIVGEKETELKTLK